MEIFSLDTFLFILYTALGFQFFGRDSGFVYLGHAGTAVEAGGDGLATAAAGVTDFAASYELPLINHIGSKSQGYLGLFDDILDGTVRMCLNKVIYLVLVIPHFVIAFLADAYAGITE